MESGSLLTVRCHFNLDGWISEGEGVEYYGYMKRDGQILEAWDTKTYNNQIAR